MGVQFLMQLNDTFAFQLDAVDIPYEREYKAIPGRRYLFDFYIAPKLLIELQGGIWMKHGAHNTGKAIQRDCEKSNLAVLHGYTVLHFTTDMVASGEALKMVERIMEE